MSQFEQDFEWWKRGQDARGRRKHDLSPSGVTCVTDANPSKWPEELKQTGTISQSTSTPENDIEGLDYCISTLENLLQPFKEDAFEKLTPKERERVHGAINMASIFWERVKNHKK